MKKNIVIIILGSLLCGAIVKADDSVMSKFIGVWYVDIDKTIEEIKKDQRSANDDLNKIKKGMELIAGMTTFKVTDKSISFIMDMAKMFPDAKEGSMPKPPVFLFSVLQTDKNSISIKYSRGHTPVKMTLSLIDNKHIRAVSSESPEYNHIVWQKNKFIATPKDVETVQEKDIIATVLGTPIGINQKKQMNGIIFGALLKKFAEDNKIKPTDADLDAFCKGMEDSKRQQEIEMEKQKQKLLTALKGNDLTEKERKQKEKMLGTMQKVAKINSKMKEQEKGMEEQTKFMQRQMGKNWVLRWQINKALYKKYGGRVIFQQAGPEPLDAYRDFLKEQKKKGAFKILNKKDEVDFWRYYTNDAMHRFYSKEEGEKSINTPWWMMKKSAK